MTTDILNKQGKKVGTIELSKELFAVRWSPDAVHQAVVSHLSNAREPIAHAKTRGEVSGGGKKPWRQKGTGRARHGSSRSPIWIGGGVTHGPRNDRNFDKKVNKKMKKFVLASLLSKKFKEGEIFVFDDLTLESPKTKFVVDILKNAKLPSSVLFVRSSGNATFSRAARNIPKIEVASEKSVHVHACLSHAAVAFEKSALEHLSAMYAKETN